MKPAEIRSLSEHQLHELETELLTEWQHLRFQEAVGQLTNNARIRVIRKDVARVHTIRTERQIDAELRSALGET